MQPLILAFFHRQCTLSGVSVLVRARAAGKGNAHLRIRMHPAVLKLALNQGKVCLRLLSTPAQDLRVEPQPISLDSFLGRNRFPSS